MFKVGFITARKNELIYFFQTSAIDIGVLSLEAYISRETEDVETFITEDVDELIRAKPDFVAVSCATENYPLAISIAKNVKENLGCVVVVGGVHITTCPESLDPVFDAGVVGEGEVTLLELVEYYKNGECDLSLMKKINGLVLHGEDGPFKTGHRVEISPLDSLPMPNRRKWVKDIGMSFIMTSRGCPYKCYFCSACRIWDGVRYFSPERVVDEVRDVVEGFSPQSIRIFDDIFTLDKKRVKKVADGLVNAGLTKDVSYICWARADLIDKEYIAIFKKANFINVAFGIESASKKMIKKLKGGTISVEVAQNAIDTLYDAGIGVTCTFVIGTPGETTNDLDATYSFIEKNVEKLDSIEINPIMPYPSTQLWADAEARGLVSSKMDWERLRDTAVLFTFDFNNYIYLNDQMPKDVFMRYVEKFIVLYKQINLGPRAINLMNRTFPISVFPAKIKSIS